jgi:selenoprotein W-related protein
LTDKLLTTFKQSIRDLRLVPSKGGCFEVKVNGELIYSKLATGEFPDEEVIVEAVGKRIR